MNVIKCIANAAALVKLKKTHDRCSSSRINYSTYIVRCLGDISKQDQTDLGSKP